MHRAASNWNASVYCNHYTFTLHRPVLVIVDFYQQAGRHQMHVARKLAVDDFEYLSTAVELGWQLRRRTVAGWNCQQIATMVHGVDVSDTRQHRFYAEFGGTSRRQRNDVEAGVDVVVGLRRHSSTVQQDVHVTVARPTTRTTRLQEKSRDNLLANTIVRHYRSLHSG